MWTASLRVLANCIRILSSTSKSNTASDFGSNLVLLSSSTGAVIYFG
jgi:hypothetical protein